VSSFCLCRRVAWTLTFRFLSRHSCCCPVDGDGGEAVSKMHSLSLMLDEKVTAIESGARPKPIGCPGSLASLAGVFCRKHGV